MTVTVYNTDTKQIVALSIIDPKSGCDWIGDCIGNTCHVMDSDAPDGVDAEADYYADGDTISWWENYLAAKQAADDRLFAAFKACDNNQHKKLGGLIADVSGDMEDHPAQIQTAINEVLGEEFAA